MSPENRNPRNSEPEDPNTTRFTRAVLESTRGGKLIGWSRYKIQRVGSLMVATVSNSSDGVFSAYGQDEDHTSKPGIMGIVLNPEGERSRQNIPKISIDFNKGAASLEERVVEELESVAIGAGFSLAEFFGHEDLPGESEPEIEQDDSLKMTIIFPEAPPSEDPFFLDKLLARIKFRESMTAEGLRDAEPKAVQNVSEALELIPTGSMSSRAEELLRQGLGLNI